MESLSIAAVLCTFIIVCRKELRQWIASWVNEEDENDDQDQY